MSKNFKHSMCSRVQEHDFVEWWTVERSGRKFVGVVKFKENTPYEFPDNKLRSLELPYTTARDWCKGIMRMVNCVDYY